MELQIKLITHYSFCSASIECHGCADLENNPLLAQLQKSQGGMSFNAAPLPLLT
jgi:hypothetical protein